MAIHLSSSISELPGIGGKALLDLKGLGVANVRDILFYVPYRYDDFSIEKAIADLKSGDTATIHARVREIKTRPLKNRKLKITEAFVEDDSGEMKLVWFNQPFLEKTLRPGTRISVAGVVDTKFGFQMTSPVHEPFGQRVHTGRIVPVYGLSGSLTMRRLRGAISSAMPAAVELVDWMPLHLIESLKLLRLDETIGQIHFPDSRETLERAVARLKFNELFLHQLMFAEVRKDRQKKVAKAFPVNEEILKTFTKKLPFILTASQKKAAWEIVQDMAENQPMNRLLEGDVGSGKTVVAAMAVAHVLAAGGRAVYMAPTELLARQQYEAMRLMLSQAVVGLLSSSQIKLGEADVSRSDFLQSWVSGEMVFAVGTHALIHEESIGQLDLVVIDEQHRFGVEQRHALLGRSDPAPHLLSMTATPIPRSLALTVYGDLDLSIIHEMPKGRKPVATKLVHESERSGMWNHVRGQIIDGNQVFVVAPLIDPSDQYGSKSVKELATELKKKELKGLRVEMLHGKQKPNEKQDVIERFRLGKTDVIVSTTVVEVGVDIPAATVMVITGAERFGLAQLHQLRGRVGRSDVQSYCYLLADNLSVRAQERLRALEKSTNGFELAEKDLALRGAGNVFGSAQSGFPDFQFATPADAELMKKARDLAAELLATDPTLQEYPLVRERIEQALDQVHLE